MRFCLVSAVLILSLYASEALACSYDLDCSTKCYVNETARCILPRYRYQGGSCICYARSQSYSVPAPYPSTPVSQSPRRVLPLVVTQDNRVQAHMQGLGDSPYRAPTNLSKLGAFMDGYYEGSQRSLDLQIRQQQLRQLQIQNAANQNFANQRAVQAPAPRTHQQAIDAARNLAKAKHSHPKLFEDQYRGLTPAQRRDVDELLALAGANKLYSPAKTPSTQPNPVNASGSMGPSSQPTPTTNVIAIPNRLATCRTIVNTNVLDSPSLQAEVIAEIPYGTQLNALSQEKMWVLVQLPNGQQGYLFQQDVEVSTP